MDGMVMPNSPDMAMAMATATTASSVSLAHDVATEAASVLGQSASMGMGGMASYLHFGIGDPFVASIFTPTQASGYVAVMFLLMLLAMLQRFLLAFSAKASHRISAHVQPSYRVEPETKSQSWIELGEDAQPAQDLATMLKVSVPHAIASSLLQVLNVAIAFLVMLGVMTLNAGYILALLAGVFLAEFALGWHNYSHQAAHSA